MFSALPNSSTMLWVILAVTLFVTSSEAQVLNSMFASFRIPHVKIFRKLIIVDSSDIAALHNSTLTLGPSSATFFNPPHPPSIFPDETRPVNGSKNACQAEFDVWEYDRFWWSPTTQIEFVTVLNDRYYTTLYSTEIYDCTQTCGTICVSKA